ncbi:MAG: family 16 glycosylhydrolase [Candidatus Marinimicrobia bacterium]|nr:family 16 glycosylhydrolase [Candidatus Neomarinimicrobiota bacterium]MCF7850404.1 family 16 glycosylhydrolase [Candidatus Neomarinimicrobiota bacterium]MCF7904547.1 family 16 glycosylhydrolase [Candidatus Neomarinimicrobiota bacterium]
MNRHILRITMLLVTLTTVFGKGYRGAEYRTIESYLYGRFEVRMQSADGDGVVSSFFTFRDYYAEGLNGSQHWNEIDLEWLGLRDNKVSTNVIIQGEWGDPSEVFLTANPHENFITYAFEWTPEAIRFYEGDRLLRTISGERADSVYHAQKLMMNIWLPAYPSWVGTFDPAILPVYAFYDWASYAAYTPGSGSVGTNNDFSPQWKDNFDEWDTSRWQKASHTWSGNNVDFTPSNAVIRYGHLILCLTTPTELGYNGAALHVEESSGPIPDNFQLSPAYPNPFNGQVNLTLETAATTDMTLNIFDHLGKLRHSVALPDNGQNLQTITWNGKDDAGELLPSGSYIIRINSPLGQASQKVVLLK